MNRFFSNKCQVVFALVAAIVLVPQALAVAEGKGISLGDAKLHLGAKLETGYDTNVGASNVPVGDVVLHIIPQLHLTLSSDKVGLDIAGYADVVRYFGVQKSYTTDYSAVWGAADVAAVFNPAGKVIFTLNDKFRRNADPRADIPGTYNATSNDSGAILTFKPGGGALAMSLAYDFALLVYDQSVNISGADYYSHRPSFDLRWKFFPKTAFTFNFNSDITRYPNAMGTYTNSDGSKTTFYNEPVNIIRATVGLVGNLSQNFSLVVLAGYGNTLADGPDNYQSVIGMVELKYMATRSTKLSLGYRRDVTPASYFSYYGFDRVYLEVAQVFFNKLRLALNGYYEYDSYGKGLAPIGGTPPPPRYDNVGGAQLVVGYDIFDWFSIDLSNRYEIRNSSFVDAEGKDACDYSKNVTLLTINFMY
jgi:hypothetical protein